MLTKYRYYSIKRLDAQNIERSLRGAALRAETHIVSVGIKTKPGVGIPENLECLGRGDDGSVYFEAYTEGQMINGELVGFILIKGGDLDAVEVHIPVRVIRTMDVSSTGCRVFGICGRFGGEDG